jgi:L-alanine-DL-glutamate epimerase-like enolase superfamily enzyme
MTRRLTVRAETWPLERPFAISRGTKTAAEVVVCEVSDGDHVGRGECVPYARYGETVAAVSEALEAQADSVARGLDREQLQRTLPAGAARNALDCALWDLDAKRAGARVWDLAGTPAPGPTVTAETIGVGSPDAMAERAAALASRPLLKLKLNDTDVLDCTRAVRAAAPDAELVIDPNESWTRDLLERVAGPLADLGVTMLEQPLAADIDGDLRGFDSPVPLCADESCHTAADVERLKDRYAMVNIKLDKTGGLTEALALADAAEAAGMQIMVGCMVATSLAMAPALLIAARAKVVDLDGPVLLKHDRSPGLSFDNGAIGPFGPEVWG